MSEWQKMGVIAPGGAVFEAVGPVAGTWWLGSGVGLVQETDAGWRPLSPQPIPGVSALAGADGLLWAGAFEGALAYTKDGKDGATWYRGRAHQVDATISAILPSPVVTEEGDVLAATEGAGIFRSTNQGRDWRVANFGLEDLHILALASAPTLRCDEVVPARIHRWEAFAATTRGIYRTPNGGRAWLPADEAPEAAVQVLAVSPNFAVDRIVFAGAADQGLLRSTDGGRTWHTYNEGWPASPPAINALWLHPTFATAPVCVAGAADGRIFRSEDGGAHWDQVHAAEGAVLCLAGDGSRLYAGLNRHGLLRSDDAGQRWRLDETLAARAFTRLASDASGALLAYGPSEPPWRLSGGSATWEPVSIRSTAVGLRALSCSNRVCWMADARGEIWRSEDGGAVWENSADRADVIEAPQSGANVLALVGMEAGGALAVTHTSGAATLWRWAPDARQWRALHTWPLEMELALAALDVTGESVLVSVGRRGWRVDLDGEAATSVIEAEAPLLRLLHAPESEARFALTGERLLRSVDGSAWTSYPLPDGVAPVDMAVLPASEGAGERLYVLGLGGEIWIRGIGEK